MPGSRVNGHQRRMRSLLGLLIAVSILEQTATCLAADEQSTGAAHFESVIRPLLAKRCYECHSTETGPANGGLILDTVEGIAAGGDRGSLLVAEGAESNLLLRAVRYHDPDLQMPPEGKLPDAELQRLVTWVESGAPLPDYTSAPRAVDAGINFEAGRQFWSFAPLADASASVTDDPATLASAIDDLVGRSLVENRLHRNPPADRRTLIRRLSFDLLGLPPTSLEVDAFVRDESPNAVSQLIDRLLDSPHYGERQARLWLDLARYADFTPDWQNPTDRGWLYRDWVVKSFNQNRPFDQFVRLQLAADLLPDTQPADLAALGFIGLSPTYWKELRLAPAVIEQIVADEWDERIDAVSRTFLGLTVSCARCHDHKFDPISTDDYYALAGVFASTQLHERPLLPEPDATQLIAARAEAKLLEESLKKLREQNAAEADIVASRLEALKRDTMHFDAPFAHVVKEAAVFVLPDGDELTRLDIRDDVTRDLPVFRRGNPSNPGAIVPRRFLTVLSSSHDKPFTNGSGRAELASAILTDSQALTARVFVNRIWDQRFGAGLVRTPSDFGAQGELPTHPELLELLASDFVAHGWDIKRLHRAISMSKTWQQSSERREDAIDLDPDNRLLWRASRRRLDFEQTRDATLAVCGLLDPTMGGPSKPIDDPNNTRRTIYATINREELDSVFRMHDVPEASSHSPRREQTTTPI